MYKGYIKECNYCKKGFQESNLNNTNLGLICKECHKIITDKINYSKTDKPIAYYRELLKNGVKF